jgi:type VI secretion system protein ImpG
LQEYLCFRRKFWFVDVLGLDRLPDDADADAFDVTFHFDRPYPEDKRFRAENVRLHCVPVTNLFEMDAEPIRVEGLVSEYRVTPSVRRRQSVETYDVRSVTGIEDETGRRHDYTPFFTFRHAASGASGRSSREDVQKRYFTTTRRVGSNDTPEVYLSLGGTELETLADAPAETLSVEIRATNGSLPREHLQEGMLSELAPDVPQIVRPENLTRPTLIRDPSGREDYYWDLLSHLSFNLASVATREALVEILDLYDWTGTDVGRANQRRLDGIRDVTWEAKEVMRRGAVMRGAEVTLEVQHGHFANEGDLCLFGEVLSRFLSLYATINSFVHLTIHLNPSGRRLRWTPMRGSQPTL